MKKKLTLILHKDENLNPNRFLLRYKKNLNIHGYITTNNKSLWSEKKLSIEEAVLALKDPSTVIITFDKYDGTSNFKIEGLPLLKIFENFIPFELLNCNSFIDFSLINIMDEDSISKLFIHLKDSGKKLAIINGNCQTKALSLYIRTNKDFSSKYILIGIPLIHESGSYDKNKLINVIRNVDLIITQNISDNNKHNPILSTNSLKKHASPHCEIVTISNLLFSGYFPQLVKIERLKRLQFKRSPLFPYVDYNLDNAFLQKTEKTILNDIKRIDFYDRQYVLDYFNEQLNILTTREKDLDIPMIDVIKAHAHKEVCFYAFNHPKLFLIEILANRLLVFLGLPKQTFWPNINYSIDNQSQIIYPSVLNALGLPWDDSTLLYINQTLYPDRVSFDEYVEIYLNSLNIAKNEK